MYEDALRASIDRAMHKVCEWGMDGYLEPLVHQGGPTGHYIRKHSERALFWWLDKMDLDKPRGGRRDEKEWDEGERPAASPVRTVRETVVVRKNEETGEFERLRKIPGGELVWVPATQDEIAELIR